MRFSPSRIRKIHLIRGAQEYSRFLDEQKQDKCRGADAIAVYAVKSVVRIRQSEGGRRTPSGLMTRNSVGRVLGHEFQQRSGYDNGEAHLRGSYCGGYQAA